MRFCFPKCWVLVGCSATIGADVQLNRIWIIRMGRVCRLRSIFFEYLLFNRCQNYRAILYLSVKTIIVSIDIWFFYMLIIEETLLLPLYRYRHWNSGKVKANQISVRRELRLKLRCYDLQTWYSGSHCLSRLYFHKNLNLMYSSCLLHWLIGISQ